MRQTDGRMVKTHNVAYSDDLPTFEELCDTV